MTTPDDILIREEKIVKLKEKADLASWGVQRKLSEGKLKKLEQEQISSVFGWLGQSDQVFMKLKQENSLLLSNKDIPFVVTKETLGTSYRLEGKIHSNGYLYLDAKFNYFSLIKSYSLFRKIMEYKGKIDPVGETKTRISDAKYCLIGSRVPQKFKGEIDTNGQLKFKTTESFWTFEREICPSRIVADPFKGDQDKTDKFLENRETLYEMYNRFRAELLK